MLACMLPVMFELMCGSHLALHETAGNARNKGYSIQPEAYLLIQVDPSIVISCTPPIGFVLMFWQLFALSSARSRSREALRDCSHQWNHNRDRGYPVRRGERERSIKWNANVEFMITSPARPREGFGRWNQKQQWSLLWARSGHHSLSLCGRVACRATC